MMRLDVKRELIENCCSMFSRLSYYDKCLPRSFKRLATRTIRSDFKRGLKQVNKKIKVYIELPKIKKVEEGMVKEERPTKKTASGEMIIVDERAVRRTKDNIT